MRDAAAIGRPAGPGKGGSGTAPGRASLAFLALLALAAGFAPWLARESEEGFSPLGHGPYAVNLDARLSPPGAGHILGTDELGRDVAARLLFGARLSVATGLLAALASTLLGALLGTLAGLRPAGAGRAVTYLVDVVQALPPLVLVAAAAAFLRPSFLVVALLIAAVSWPEPARLVRAEVERLATAPFVEAARACGAGERRVVFSHVLPHALRPVLATAPYALGAAVLAEASLSFLGLGTPPPYASWGRALADSRAHLSEAWWCVLPPALALLALVLATRRVGEAFSE